MVKEYRYLLIILLAPILFNLALGARVTLTPIETSVEPGETVIYNITVENNDDPLVKYTVFMLNPASQLSRETLILNKSQNETVQLKMFISNNTNLGDYFDTLYVNYNGKTDFVRIDYSVTLPASKRVDIEELIMAESFIPTEPFEMNITTLNSDKVRKGRLLISIYQDNFNLLSFDRAFDIGIGEETNTISINFDPFFSPGEYLITTSVEILGDEIYRSVGNLEVLPYSDIIVEKEVEKDIFGKTVSIAVSNNGTGSIDSYTLSEPVSILESILLTTKSGAIRSNGNLIWEISNLAPSTIDDYTTIEYVYSVTYVPLLLLPFFISGAILLYVLWNRKVIVTKTVYNHKMSGGELEVSLRINVKNVSLQKLNDLLVVEKVPNFVKNVHGFGSLHPNHVKGKKSHKLHWELPELKPREEAVISYKIKSNVEILGRIIFPPTVVYLKDKKKTYERKSNAIEIETHSKTIENLEK